MSCLPYLCLFVHVYSGGIYFVCRRAHVLFTLFVFVCTVYSGGIYFVCRRAHFSFTLFVFACTCI
jgi:hypothetical protein